MSSTATENKNPVRLEIAGNLKLYEIISVKQKLLDTLADGNDLVLDLEKVRECDTSGIQLLISVFHTAGLKGKSIVVSGCSDTLRHAAERSGFNMESIFTVENTGAIGKGGL